MSFKSKMKKTEQEDALFESNANPVITESSVVDSDDHHIMVSSDNMKMIADFINRVDVLTNPEFKIKAEYVPSEEFKSVVNSFTQSAVEITGELKRYYDAIPEKTFEKVRSQIMEDVKKSQSNQRIELWVWRILYALFGLVGVLWGILELMRRYSVESPMEVLLLIFIFIGWTCLFYKLGGWLKN